MYCSFCRTNTYLKYTTYVKSLLESLLLGLRTAKGQATEMIDSSIILHLKFRSKKYTDPDILKFISTLPPMCTTKFQKSTMIEKRIAKIKKLTFTYLFVQSGMETKQFHNFVVYKDSS